MDFINNFESQKKLGIKDFYRFCVKNWTLVLAGISAILLVYGVRLGSYCFGVDTELYLGQKRYINWLEIGRFGLVFLQKITSLLIFHKETFNPWLATALSCVFLLFGTLLWIYFLDFFANGKIKSWCYIPFMLLFITPQVWTEQIYFVCQSAECILIVALSALASFFIFNGVVTESKSRIFTGFLISVLCVSVYQGVIVLIGCGILAFFVLSNENSQQTEKKAWFICLRILCILIAVIATYFVLNKIVLALTHTEKSSYLTKMLAVSQDGETGYLTQLALYIYKLTFAAFPPVQKICEPIFAKHARSGWAAVESIRNQNISATVLLPVATTLFIIQLFRNKNRSVILRVAGICLPLSIFALPLLGGSAPLRSQYVLPFAFAFMILHLISQCQKPFSRLLALIAFLVAARQTGICAMLNYMSAKTYETDVRLSTELAERLYSVGVDSETPVFIYGIHKSPEGIHGEVAGFSPFEWASATSKSDSTDRGLAFMQTQGYFFLPVHEDDEQLIEQARNYAQDMPDFPATNSVQNLGDVAIIRLSETTYQEKY